jgi:hypothetical protein
MDESSLADVSDEGRYGKAPPLSDDRNPCWEIVGDEVLVLDHHERAIHRFYGDAGAVARRLAIGDLAGWDPDDDLQQTVARTLMDAGVLDPSALDRVAPRGFDRRTMLAAGAAFGVTILALPTAAAAESTPTTTTLPDANAAGFFAQSATPIASQTIDLAGRDA